MLSHRAVIVPQATESSKIYVMPLAMLLCRRLLRLYMHEGEVLQTNLQYLHFVSTAAPPLDNRPWYTCVLKPDTGPSEPERPWNEMVQETPCLFQQLVSFALMAARLEMSDAAHVQTS